ncbi:hypothetical protein KY290_020165 [Solanum tuberosum]|uniref:UBC core domain-containing protein n=1 Tax=Solanum tuberosum TaxID=4113 RepID=A0ABQ7VLF5_SOLTU|nr:hypothetical protein KY289_019346 [Solanum tuberosum]KAH0764092.1 hypothetical protein KY290_020165 [Solanum tuberosum]
MAQNNNCRKRPNILITETLGTRKTTMAASLAVVTELRHNNVGDFANEENLTNDWDDTFNCYYINEDLLMRMSTPARKRLMRDFKRLQQDPPAGISGAPYDNNIMLWNAVIFGPDDTPWDGGTFKLTLQFSEDYPNKPPTVQFVSRMFHPNIYADGSICLDILQNQWSPIYDVAAILTSIQSLLCDPNPNSPANSEAARMFSENKREYNRKVREIVEQSWTAD